METLFRNCTKGFMVSMAVWATACSDVGFTPTDENASFEMPDGSQKETFSFDDDGSGAKVDVLFVVDNSGSMYEEQGKLGSALASFITSLGQVNWQIGITTTDVSDGPYGLKGSLLPFAGIGSKVLTAKSPNYATAFANTVVRQEILTCGNTATNPCPSSDERPLEAARLAMSKAFDENSGLFRPDADLAIVVLSDEDEGSNLFEAITAQAVVASFATVFGGSKTLSTYGIIVEPGDTACYSAQSAFNNVYYGTRVSQLAQLTDGVTGSICAADFGPTLTSIGDRVREMVRSITLKYTPDPNTVLIMVRPADPSLTWQVNGNTVSFSKAPNKGTKVDVYYMPQQP